MSGKRVSPFKHAGGHAVLARALFLPLFLFPFISSTFSLTLNFASNLRSTSRLLSCYVKLSLSLSFASNRYPSRHYFHFVNLLNDDKNASTISSSRSRSFSSPSRDVFSSLFLSPPSLCFSEWYVMIIKRYIGWRAKETEVVHINETQLKILSTCDCQSNVSLRFQRAWRFYVELALRVSAAVARRKVDK